MTSLRIQTTLSLACVLLLGACGSSSSDSPAAVCKQGCTKAQSLCFGDAGTPDAGPTGFQAICEATCTAQTMSGGKPCSNSSAMIAAYKACSAKTTCSELQTCLQTIPPCAGAAGTGGASGSTGGASGATGGASGSTGGTAGGTGGRAGGTGGAGGGAAGTGSCATLRTCCGTLANAAERTQCQMAADGATPATCDGALVALRAQGYCP